MPRLLVFLPDGAEKVLDLRGPVIVGRQSSNDIQVLSAGVSRQHAEIRAAGGGFVVRDLNSRNGTFLNGERVTESPLKDGDEVRVGEARIRFEEVAGGAGPPAPAPEPARGIEGPAAAIAERFQLLEKIGIGPAATVYRAIERSRERAVALKVLDPRAAALPGVTDRFRSAVAAAAAVGHPSLVGILATGQAGPSPWVAMEYVPGATAAAALERGGPLPASRAIAVAVDAARGLGALHAQGIVHGGVHPGNLFLAAGGGARLAEPGLASRAPEPSPHVAPEMRLGEDRDPRSDLYALGATLFHLLTGRAPAAGTDPLADDGFSPGLFRILERCLAPRPEGRPASAHELLADLERQIEVERSLDEERTRRQEARAASAPAAPRPAPPAPMRSRRALPVLERPRGTSLAWLAPLAFLAGILLTDQDLVLDPIRRSEERRSTLLNDLEAETRRAFQAEKQSDWEGALSHWRMAAATADLLAMPGLSERIGDRVRRLEKIRDEASRTPAPPRGPGP